MAFYVIIPARFGSQRLPGKPLLDVGGLPMVQRVFLQAQKSDATKVVVATDNQQILDAVQSFSGEAFLTKEDHPSGTDRLEETVSLMKLADDDIVVNVQGDEPLIPPEVINQVALNLAENPQCGMATLVEPITRVEDCFNPNVVKAVSNEHGEALYFSRAPIPWSRETYNDSEPSLPDLDLVRRHIGIYAYRVSLLKQFVLWPVAALERIEKLEQLRVLANGENIHIEEACTSVPGGVDTQDDLDRINQLLREGGQ